MESVTVHSPYEKELIVSANQGFNVSPRTNKLSGAGPREQARELGRRRSKPQAHVAGLTASFLEAAF